MIGRLRVPLMVCVLIVLIAFPAMAVTSYGDRIVGESYFTRSTATTATLAGSTYVGSYWGDPSQITVELDMWKGGTYVKGQTWSLIDTTSVAGMVDGSSQTTGSWQGYGWHYANWEADLYSDSCTTYPTAPGNSPASLEQNTLLAAYVQENGELSSWQAIGYYSSSALLKAALGQKNGVALDLVLQVGLREYLQAGDSFPGLLLAPDHSSALVLFFHSDGSRTRVTVSATDDTWAVTNVDSGDYPTQ